MRSNRNNPVYWFERGSRGIVNVDCMFNYHALIIKFNNDMFSCHYNYYNCSGFDVGVGIVQILIFLVGAAAVGVGKYLI